MRNVVVIIPARLNSTRLSRKMLLSETGKPLVVHTYEAALKAKLPSMVVVATDSPEIQDALHQHGGKAVLTSPDLASGTDRVAEVARNLVRSGLCPEVVINLQGDEPETDSSYIDQLADQLLQDHDLEMGTLAAPICSPDQFQDPACVKVVVDQRQNALYFSRATIPYPRNNGFEAALFSGPPSERVFLQHIGVYAYRLSALFEFSRMPVSPLEKMEGLEQLRALEAGWKIRVVRIEKHFRGIDTPEDYRRFVERWQNRYTLGKQRDVTQPLVPLEPTGAGELNTVATDSLGGN